MFNLGSSYFHVALTTVRHLLNVNRHAHHNTPLIYQEKNGNSTRCKSKPDCSQPGYFPSRMLTIVNWSLVDSPASSAALAVLVPQQIPPCRWKFWKGRGQGHVSNFYNVDLENFATASRRYTGEITHTYVAWQWRRLFNIYAIWFLPTSYHIISYHIISGICSEPITKRT